MQAFIPTRLVVAGPHAMHTEAAHPSTHFNLRPSAIVIFGPPLPGRRALARAVEHRIPNAHRVRAGRHGLAVHQILHCLTEREIPIIEGDFRTSAQREALFRLIRDAGANPVFIAWLCDSDEAEREIYRRYASLPQRYADKWWRLWRDDHARREGPEAEIPARNLVVAGAHDTHEEQVARVAHALGLPDDLPEPLPAPRRVLVVDDDEDQRLMLGDALEELGCEVWRAKNAYEALGIADRIPLDLVVSDQQMPGVSGLELARTLARRHPQIHVALLTGYAEEIADRAFDADGVELLLSKPTRAGDLVRLLDELTA